MSDPVSDFLEREQNLFAEFEQVPPVPAADVVEENGVADDDFGNLQDAGIGRDSGVDLSGLDEPVVVAAADPVVIPAAQPSPPVVNGNGGHAQSRTPTLPTFVPEKIRVWKEEQQKILADKDAEEQKKREELRESAKKELEDWYKQREKTLSLAHAENLKQEEAIAASFASQQNGEAQWEAVNQLIEQGKSKSAKDLSRLKSLLGALKDIKIEK